MKYRFHPAATAEHYDNVNFYEDRLAGLGADYLKEFESVMAHICSAPNFYPTIGAHEEINLGTGRLYLPCRNIKVIGTARLYRAASVLTAGLADFITQVLYRHRIAKELHQRSGETLHTSR